jgi:NADPH-dependent curcumin reductase CurA
LIIAVFRVVGDLIGASLPFSTYQIVSAETLGKTPNWKLTGHLDDSNITLGIGLLGMPGCTAWGGVLEVLRPKEGETIFISAAAGAVGSLVGMLAKNLFHCTVIGSCGGSQKCELIKSKYGFDHAIDYKTLANKDELVAKLKEVAPDGIDMYFENVGGMHFDAALECLRQRGRVAVCGFINEYHHNQGLKLQFDAVSLLYKQQRIEGVLCFPWLYEGKFVADMSKFLQEGKILAQETYFDGIEQWPLAFISLFTGANIGKVVVRV